jgi:hypothetical protein
VWVYTLPPYRGILVMIPVLGQAGEPLMRFEARIETLEVIVAGPGRFATIKEAQGWIEGELYRQQAAAGHELRRHGHGRRLDDLV